MLVKKTKKMAKSKSKEKPKKPEKKCKRGYKFCKGEGCDEMMHIHKKICPKCGYKNTMKKKIQNKDKVKELLFKEINKDRKKHVTKGQLRKIKLYIENTIFSDEKFLGKRLGYQDFHLDLDKEMKIDRNNFKSKKLKIVENEKRQDGTMDVFLNGVQAVIKLGRDEVNKLNFYNGDKIFLERKVNPINDVLVLTYEDKESDSKFIFTIFGENLVKKIRNYPKQNSLIQYNVETQKVFKVENLMSVGQKFPGESKIEINLFEFNKKSKKIEFKSKSEINLKSGDLVKIASPFKEIDTETKCCVLGMITSDGGFKIFNLRFADLLQNPTDPLLITPEFISLNKSDEIFSTFEFINPTKFLIGTQKGTIFLCKLKNKKIKILNSFNRFNNFLITNIATMPSSGKEGEEIFAYSTGDGFIKIQSTEEEFPVYEYQSISKTIRSLKWDFSTRALIFSDENEKFFVSFYYFNPSNVKHILSKKITKTKYFVEAISQIRGLNTTFLADRKGNLSCYNSNKSRLYFYKHKEILKLDIKLRFKIDKDKIEIWNSGEKGQEKNINRDKRARVAKEEALINPCSIFCIDGAQLSNDLGFVAFGNAAGLVSFYVFSQKE